MTLNHQSLAKVRFGSLTARRRAARSGRSLVDQFCHRLENGENARIPFPMQWSRLKRQAERFFAPSVAGRVELRATRYRGAHDQTGRGYITVDGREVWNMCSLTFEAEESERIQRHIAHSGASARQAQIEIDPQLQSEGVLAQWDFYRALEEYCNNSIDANLASPNPLIRSLSMLDARTGKRRLEALSMENEHPMVIFFHHLRTEAEQLGKRATRHDR